MNKSKQPWYTKLPALKRAYERGFKAGVNAAVEGHPRIIIVAPTVSMGYTVARWFDLNPKCVIPPEERYIRGYGKLTTFLLYIGAGYSAYEDYHAILHELEMTQGTIIFVPEFQTVHRSIANHIWQE